MVALLCATLAIAMASTAQSATTLTVYEQPDNELQTKGYDAARNAFVPLPAAQDGKLVHHYWFRTYTDATYDVDAEAHPLHFPPTAIFYPSVNKSIWGIPEGQRPLIGSPHYTDGAPSAFASDMVRISLVQVEADYVANTHRNMTKMAQDGYIRFHETSIIVNAPIVPMGSRLLDPSPEREFVPIEPVLAWNQDNVSQMFFLETTSKEFQKWANARFRPDDTRNDMWYNVAFTPAIADDHATLFEPLYYLNQYPSAEGPQRNVIPRIRTDLGYTPLHQLYWVNALPANYVPNSVVAQRQFDSPFQIRPIAIFVNAPQIGAPGEMLQARSWPTGLPQGDVVLEGSIPLHANVPVEARAGERVLATAQTTGEGYYALRFSSPNTPVDVYVEGELASTYSPEGADNGAPAPILILPLLLAALWRRK